MSYPVKRLKVINKLLGNIYWIGFNFSVLITPWCVIIGHVTLNISPPSPPSAVDHLSSLSGQPLVKQDSLDTYNERDPFKNDDARDEEEDPEDTDSGIEGEVDPLDRDVIIQPPPPPPPLRPPTERVNFPKGLPWAPKVRLESIFISAFNSTLK